MSNNLTLERGTSSFTSAAAKFGADGLAGGVYGNSSLSGLMSTGNNQPISAFTWDAWIHTSGASGVHVAVGEAAGTNQGSGCWLGVNGAHAEFSVGTAGGAVTLVGTITVNDGAWHLISGSWTGGATGTARLFVDGVADGSGTGTSTSTGSSGWGSGYVAVGGFGTITSFDWPSGSFIDEVSISNVAQYTGGFTPPSAAFSNSRSGQVALYHFDGDANDYNGVSGSPVLPPRTPTNWSAVMRSLR